MSKMKDTTTALVNFRPIVDGRVSSSKPRQRRQPGSFRPIVDGRVSSSKPRQRRRRAAAASPAPSRPSSTTKSHESSSESSPTSLDELKCSLVLSRCRRRGSKGKVVPLPFDDADKDGEAPFRKKSSSDCTASSDDEGVDRMGRRSSDLTMRRDSDMTMRRDSDKTMRRDSRLPMEASVTDDESTTSQESADAFEELPQDGDRFDPASMPAPPTILFGRDCHRFRRHSRSLALPEYALGEEGHPVDMVGEASSTAAHLAVTSLLREMDAAFVRRSDGRWCYAILAERVTKKNPEESVLRFVVADDGSTKNVSFRKWGRSVRLVREPVETNALLRSQGTLAEQLANEAMPQDLVDPR